MRILDLRKPGSATAAQIDPERKGTFTTNLLAEVENYPIALYFTGWQHAGENLAQVLDRRAADLAPPIQMCDALARNQSPEVPTILAHCLSHGRREFVSLVESFPEQCQHVLEALREVYHADAQAKALGLNPAQRLAHHQTHSQPVLVELRHFANRNRSFVRAALRRVQICHRNAIADLHERMREEAGRYLRCRAQCRQKVWQLLGVYSDGI